MTFQDNRNSNIPNNPSGRMPRRDTEEPGWGIPLAIGAFILVAGLLVFSTGEQRLTTAANDTPASTAPVQAPAANPAPAKQ